MHECNIMSSKFWLGLVWRCRVQFLLWIIKFLDPFNFYWNFNAPWNGFFGGEWKLLQENVCNLFLQRADDMNMFVSGMFASRSLEWIVQTIFIAWNCVVYDFVNYSLWKLPVYNDLLGQSDSGSVRFLNAGPLSLFEFVLMLLLCI